MKASKISVFAAIVVLVSIVLSLFSLQYPLLGSLGSESGILFGAIIGPLMYFGGAFRGGHKDPRGFGSDLLHECLVGFFALLIFAVALFANAYFVQSCAPARGFGPFLTHAVPVILFNCALGLVIGRFIGHRIFALVVALLAALAYLVIRAYVWWLNPSFRILSHPLVAIDGDLMGGAGLSLPILGFRAATLFFAFALIFLGAALFSQNRDRFLKQNVFQPSSLVPVATFFILGGFVHFAVTDFIVPKISDRDTELSNVVARGQFRLHMNPQKITTKKAHAILAEANLWAERIQRRMGKVSDEPIHIWLYDDVATLEKFTGAAHVHFALPTHREIHITDGPIPHPTLGHEIAHIYIGEHTSTFFGIPGAFGFLTNQGLTEGLAVMLTEELSIKRELTIEQQSSALLKIGYLPNLEEIFSLSPLSFFEHNPQISYSLAGAYLKLLLEQFEDQPKRNEIISQLASKGRIDAAFASAEEKEKFGKQFVETLKAMELPSDAIASMSAVYNAKSILSNTCTETSSPATIFEDSTLAASDFLRRANLADKESLESQRLFDKAGDHYWKAGDPISAANAWNEISPMLFTPDERRSILLKQNLAPLAETQSVAHILDFIVFSKDNDSTKTIASALNLAILAERHKGDAFAGYLILRTRATAHPNSADHAELFTLSTQPSLPVDFQIESLRVVAMGTALGPDAGSAPELFRQVGELSQRSATILRMRDYAERAERIAFALSLALNDELRNDTHLLGLERYNY